MKGFWLERNINRIKEKFPGIPGNAVKIGISGKGKPKAELADGRVVSLTSVPGLKMYCLQFCNPKNIPLNEAMGLRDIPVRQLADQLRRDLPPGGDIQVQDGRFVFSYGFPGYTEELSFSRIKVTADGNLTKRSRKEIRSFFGQNAPRRMEKAWEYLESRFPADILDGYGINPAPGQNRMFPITDGNEMSPIAGWRGMLSMKKNRKSMEITLRSPLLSDTVTLLRFGNDEDSWRKYMQIISEGPSAILKGPVEISFSDVCERGRHAVQELARSYQECPGQAGDRDAKPLPMPKKAALYPDVPEIRISSQAFACTVTPDSVKTEKKKPLKERDKKLALKRYRQCMALIDEELPSGYQYKSGPGLLFAGETELCCTTSGRTYGYTFSMPSYKDSLPEWRKAFRRQNGEWKDSIRAEEEKIRQEMIRSSRPLLDNYLYVDTLSCIAANDRYVTENAVVQMMRGTKVALNIMPEKFTGTGCYKLVSAGTIREAAGWLIREGFVTRKRLSGTYGSFYVLHISGKGEDFLKAEPGLLEETAPEGDRAASLQWEQIGKDGTVPSFLAALELAGNKGFVCRHMDEYAGYLRTAPKEFKSLVKMKKAATEDPFLKKVYQQILKK